MKALLLHVTDRERGVVTTERRHTAKSKAKLACKTQGRIERIELRSLRRKQTLCLLLLVVSTPISADEVWKASPISNTIQGHEPIEIKRKYKIRSLYVLYVV